jgi:membrane associated rhomboid family serine protease
MNLLRRLPFSPVSAGLLVAMALLWLGSAVRVLDLSGLLVLAPASIWRGEVWRPFTAPLLVRGLLDLFFSGMALVWIGGELERFWKPVEWLLYGVLCAVVAGFVASACFYGGGAIPAGPALLLVPLLVARVRLAGSERIQLTSTFSISVLVATLFWTAMIVGTALVTGLPLSGLVALVAAAATGWTYLTLRWFFLRRQSARPTPSNRFGRLEF